MSLFHPFSSFSGFNKQLQYSILRYARTNAVYVEEVGGVSGETETLNMVSRVNTILFLSQVFSEKCI